jgi:hypothetical protein
MLDHIILTVSNIDRSLAHHILPAIQGRRRSS